MYSTISTATLSLIWYLLLLSIRILYCHLSIHTQVYYVYDTYPHQHEIRILFVMLSNKRSAPSGFPGKPFTILQNSPGAGNI